ncbi:type II secretion system minor pseudopilin GspJ [Salinisphaera sp. Q1T1-3]|uniref:type II secretion system minor pseudopilin GspJ n=1 Tax=Salinisphaera sp. Q1T1-3 TaxID=2321229 RepID=UPI000E76A90D|nr:type II secretion system minor pseudopilin GspJ [Salinisphaera sp. Q1T1-3]RJS91761.1 type II secretion system protein GspJ [Salinisphaera sp. Q1T1-3]
MSASSASQRGFTLIELLIAIAVFAVMAAIAYGGLSSVIASRESVDAALDRSKHLQMALWRLQQDIEQTVDRPVRDRYGDVQPAVLGSPQTGLYVTRAGWPNPLGEARSTLQRVHYQLDAGGHLVRQYFRVLDQSQDSVPVSNNLLDGVNQLEWRYLDDNGQWQDRWPPDDRQRNPSLDAASDDGNSAPAANARALKPPVAIELTLDTAQWGRLRMRYMIAGSRP